MDAYEKFYNLSNKDFKKVYNLFLKLERDNKNMGLINKVKSYGFTENEINELIETQTYK